MNVGCSLAGYPLSMVTLISSHQGVNRKCHPHEGQIRNLRQAARYSGTHTVEKDVVTAPWKKTESISYAKVIGTDAQLEETLCEMQKQVPQTKWQTLSTKKSVDRQKKGHFEDDEKSSS